jgi:tetratricopeptide (TPR) repeat protein
VQRGDRIGPYVLDTLLAQGGMAVVYRARSVATQTDVALKIPTIGSETTDDVLEYMRHEVQAMARLSHPHIVPVLDWGTTPDGLFFLAMPLVEDRSLRDVAGRLDERGILALVDQLLDALAYAHDRGVVHRDVKARNLLIAHKDGGAPHLWLTDFGIASLDRKGPLDHAGGPIGTPTYMAPEQLTPGPLVGPEADLYAVGVLLYLLFEGRRPFAGQTLDEVIANRRAAPRPRFTPRALRAIPPGLELIVQRLLQEDPLSRYPSASSLRRALSELTTGASSARDGEVCLECGERLPPGTGFCPVCETGVSTIIDTGPSPATMATHAARNVTALAVRLDPAQRPLVAALLERAGAHVKWAGDGLAFAAMGVHGSTGAEVAQAAELGLALGSFAHAGVGIASGTVRMAGTSVLDIGADRARALADRAPPGRVHVEERLRGSLSALDASSVVEPGAFLLDARALASRVRMSEARITPLLDAAHDVAQNKRARAITLVAAPGMGKSLALSELAERLEGEGWTCLSASAQNERDPLGALRDAIRGWAGVWPGADRAAFARELEGRTHDPALALRVASVLSEPSAGVPSGGARARALDVIGAWIGRVAEDAPVLLAIDDLPQLDATSRELASLLAERLADRPVLVVASARPTDTPLEASGAMMLGPLTEDDAGSLISGLGEASPTERTRMLRLAEGHPGRLLELARLWRNRASAELPTTYDDVVHARIDALSADERSLLSLAASLGRTLWSAQLLAIADASSRSRLPVLVDRLIGAELIEWVEPSSIPGTRELRFTNETLRETARATLPHERARTLHAEAAMWLERNAAHLGGSALESIASHWELAGATPRAAAWEVRAGRRAEALGSMQDALDRYQRALAHLDRQGAVTSSVRPDGAPPLPVDVPGLLCALCRVAAASGDKEVARRAAERALAVEEPPRALVRGQARAALAEMARMEGEPDRALAFIDAALAELGDDGDRILRAQLLGRRGWILGYVLGKNDEGRASSERALMLLDGLDVPAIESHVYSELGANELRAGRWDRQLECNRRALALAQEAEELPGQVRAHINLSVCYTNRGELERAADHASSAASTALRTGLHRSRVVALNNLGIVRLDQGDLDEARRLLELVVELCARFGIRDILQETLPMLGRVALGQGQHDEALRHARAGAESASAENNPVGVALGLRVEALVHARSGDLVAARAALERATIALGPGGDAYELAVTHLTRALLDGTDHGAIDARLRALGADPALETKRWSP